MLCMRRALGLLASFVSLIVLGSASGTLFHIEVLRRAIYNLGLPSSYDARALHETTLPLADWLEDSRPYAQAGAFFPDFGYNCLKADAEAEAAHWPPFLVTGISYLLDTYPNFNESKTGQELLSFILGLAAHQTTDATWHSIKFTNGFLRVMADLDFDGDYAKAHAVLDTGADTILARRFANTANSRGFAHLSQSWSVPVDDILRIYDQLGISLNPIKLRYCMTRGFAALSVMRRFGTTLADRYQRLSPFMTSHLDDYYLGSLEETSTSTAICWLAIETWLITGQVLDQKHAWEICEPMATIGRRGKAGPYTGNTGARLSLLAQASLQANTVHESTLFDLDDLISKEIEFVETHMNEEMGLLHICSKRANITNARPVRPTSFENSYFLTPSISYAEFGRSLILLESQAATELIVGSPKESDLRDMPSKGSVYIIPLQLGDDQRHTSSTAHPILRHARNLGSGGDLGWDMQNPVESYMLPESNLRVENGSFYFGRSVANVSLGGDQCLAVLSSKRIEIFRYRNNSLEPTPSTIIYNHRSQEFSSPPIASYLYSFTHAGRPVLAIANPWAGRRASGAIYLFSHTRLNSQFLSIHSADLIIEGPLNGSYHRLGSSITYSEKYQLLLVGEAGNRSVVGYTLDLQNGKASNIFQIHDPSQQSLHTGFGSSSLLARGDYIYVGSMTEDQLEISQVGAVRVFQLTCTVEFHATPRHGQCRVVPLATLIPQQADAIANFGAQIVAADHIGGIYISSPGFAQRGSISFVSHLQISQIPTSMTFQTSMEGADRLQSGLSSKILNIQICALGYEVNERFGETLVVDSQGHVIVGAPLASGLSQEQRLTGKVYYFDNLSC